MSLALAISFLSPTGFARPTIAFAKKARAEARAIGLVVSGRFLEGHPILLLAELHIAHVRAESGADADPDRD